MIANELIDDWSSSQKSGIVLKLDLEKAFDMVDWEFLDTVLRIKGFGSLWRNWINGCLSSANYSIIINGRPRGKIIPTRGIRQGDPLSHFLFIIVADCLSRLLAHNSSLGLNIAHPICQSSFSINHIQFANDTLLFSIAERYALQNLFDVIHIF